MSKLQIGQDGFSLESKTFEDVVAILGRRGRGKTTTATVIVEGLHAVGERFVVTDPVGVWYGLKSSRDGRRPGIPVVVMGGDHGDVPLAPESGEIIADFVADPTSPSVVLDLKLFTQGEMVRFMTAFLSRLYHVNPGKSLHVVLDEADQFAPQRPMHGEEAMLGAAQRVTKMGRAKGLHPILITQRPATLSKNVLTQAGLLISHAITGPQDRKAVDEWIKANAEEGERDKFLAELSGLPRGTAYFWSPDIPLFRQVAVRDRETFDSSATPKRGEAVKPKALAEVDLEALKVRIAATIEKAKAEDPRELRKRIAELEREVRAAKAAQPAAKLAEQKRVEVPVLKEGQLKRLEATVERMLKHGQALESAASVLPQMGRAIRDAIMLASSPPPQRATVALATPSAARSLAAPPPALRPSGNGRGHRAPAEGLTGTQQAILNVIATLALRGVEINRVALARWLGIHPNGGRFLTDLARLRDAGLVTRDGVALTAEGSGLAVAYETGQEAVLTTLANHKKSGTRLTMMTCVLNQGPFTSRVELAAALGIHPNGGRFLTDLARLREMGLVPPKGEIRAQEVVFR